MFRFSPRTQQADRIKWREWGEAAFQEATECDKLIVVVLTAFWCGYCQRLDETSLSNHNVLALLNAFFIPIRVEEGQRPDVDLRYNQDGWPTVAFLTPTGDPLFSINYTAPEPFTDVLIQIVDAFQRDRAGLLATGVQNRVNAVARQTEEKPAQLGAPIVDEIAGMVEGLADTTYGGYGTQFKFLHPDANAFLLYLYELTGEAAHLDHVSFTLQQMYRSRTFDDKDGGFFRYSSKPDWQEPHPEKLLDDQAALVRNYLRTYLLTDETFYGRTAEGLMTYLDATLSQDNSPCFFGCQDYVQPELDLSVPRTGPPALLSLIDTYVYCDANAQVASAYLDAWWILGQTECQARGLEIIEQLWTTMRAPHGGMFHYSDGEPHVPGLLMDSIMMGAALLDAFSTSGESIYLERATTLAQDIVHRHRNPTGGFFDISELGPANLQVPIPVLTQNAQLALFFVSLADLSRDLAYRKMAHWALKPFPNAHRQHEAFAAGFGHALSRLLTLPLIVILQGPPGHASIRALARAALSQFQHGDIVLQFRAEPDSQTPGALVQLGERQVGPITDPDALRPSLVIN